MKATRAFRLVLAVFSAVACGSESPAPPPGGAPAPAAPYASELVSFEPGHGAGFGEDLLPGVVFGPPRGKGNEAGSFDVLSLGKGGSIVLGFGASSIADADGPDFVVFENAFWAGGDPAAVFAEPGEVSVSEDGEHWLTFPCDAAGDGSGRFAGCAGFTPTLEYDPALVVELDVSVTGGDAFDLAELGLEMVRYVRVRDVSQLGAAPTAGFDLDAVGIAHPADVPP